jgi:hypothetical protein
MPLFQRLRVSFGSTWFRLTSQIRSDGFAQEMNVLLRL